jgi:hypothetical protein
MAYPLPPWLPSFPDTGEQVLRGYRLGAEIQERQESEALAREKMAQEQAYNQAQLGLERSKLEEQQRLNQIQVQEASRLMQAQDSYRAAVDSGADPTRAYMKYLSGIPSISHTGMAGMASEMFRERQAMLPERFGRTPGGIEYGIYGGELKFDPRVPDQNYQMDMATVRALRAEKAATRARMARDPYRNAPAGSELRKSYEADADRIAEIDFEIRETLREHGNQLPGPPNIWDRDPSMNRIWDPLPRDIRFADETDAASPPAAVDYRATAVNGVPIGTNQPPPGGMFNNPIIPSLGTNAFPATNASGPSITQSLPIQAQKVAQQAMLRNFRQPQMPRSTGMTAPNYWTNPAAPVDFSSPDYGGQDQFVPYGQRTNLPPYLTPDMGD